MDTIIYTRIKALCDQHQLSISRLEAMLGLGNSTLAKWRGGASPSAASIARIADYFGVTCDYLIGVSDQPYRLNETDDPGIVTLQRARQRMDSKDRDRMMQMLRLGFEYAFQDDEEEE